IERLSRAQAIVTAVAGLMRKFFAEIFEQRRAPAFASLGVMYHLAKLLACDSLFLFAFFVDKTRLLHHVAGAEEQYAIARQSITTRASRFLIVTLDVLRQIVMNDKADIRFVDA